MAAARGLGGPPAGGPRRPGLGMLDGLRRHDRAAAVAALVLLVVIGVILLLIPRSRSAPRPRSAAAAGPGSHHQARHGSRGAAAKSSAAPARGTSPASTPVVTLTPDRAVAFGPGGPAHGDDPHDASLAIDGRPATAWQTDWYTTSQFGNLQRGTGLLLDMGHPVSITTAAVTLGSAAGADFQLRAGSAAALPALRPVATAANASGIVRLRLGHPVQARYVLVWFTRLPPDPPAPTGRRSTTSGCAGTVSLPSAGALAPQLVPRSYCADIVRRLRTRARSVTRSLS